MFSSTVEGFHTPPMFEASIGNFFFLGLLQYEIMYKYEITYELDIIYEIFIFWVMV
ncbi:hypothetical protein QJS04_geneDACA022971 [Acorus gramineus]|uniref:Uncharacterized protein n=1 Tax=Acorus gramineus TaxID=55184 RepID=A0AAV8ZYL7_ACOGR|nr:hypothetical protein QJS04_geneDACA022971 [Acorus gramineus]